MIPQRLKGENITFLYNSVLDNCTKKDFEMVIARYDEDISWSNNYKAFRTIYNKGEYLEGSIPLENNGHLADTILNHIIRNYENLATVTFFAHGSFNYRKDQIIKESGSCHRKFSDFVSVDPNHCSYIKRRDLANKNDKIYDYSETYGEVYKHLFNEEYVPNFDWACGLWLSIGKKYILSRPKEFYQKILDWILSDYNGSQPSQDIYRTRGVYIERFLLNAFRRF